MSDYLREGYIGNPAQLVTLRRLTVNEGKARGTEIIEVKTGGGLELDILPNSGLDIGQCRFQGVNMSWMSKNGYDSPAVFIPYEEEFAKTFSGGLLYTCGLRSVGPGNRDAGEWHPLHGRYHGLCAEQVCAEIVEDEIIVKGTVRETALFGHQLELRRVIRIPAFGASVTVEDTLTNLAPREEEYAMIYHCNFGYPLLSEKAHIVFPEARETIPRTAFAKEFLGKELTIDAPIPGEEERCFFQKMEKEFWARLENPDLGVDMTICWSGDTLPMMLEWRSMASGDYCLGLEPINCFAMGRHEERENGTLPVLKPFERIQNTVQISFSAK